MAKPTATTEAGGTKVLLLADNTATTPIACTPCALSSAQSGAGATYPVGWMGIATHAEQDTYANPGSGAGFSAWSKSGVMAVVGGIQDGGTVVTRTAMASGAP